MNSPEPVSFARLRIFVSYSHDSQEHCSRVLALAQQLRRDGIDAELDQFHQEQLKHWPSWCEEQLRPENSDFVLCVCTAEYKRRVEGNVAADVGKGVFWEGRLITNYLYDRKGNSRCVPVLLDKAMATDIPLMLAGYTHFSLMDFCLNDFQSDYAKLYRLLTGQAGTKMQEIGRMQKLPPLPEEESRTDFIRLMIEEMLAVLKDRPLPASNAQRPHNLPPWTSPEYFIGRRDELQKLRDGLTVSGNNLVVQPQIISGAGERGRVG